MSNRIDLLAVPLACAAIRMTVLPTSRVVVAGRRVRVRFAPKFAGACVFRPGTLISVFAVLAGREVRWLGCLRGRALKVTDAHLPNRAANCDAGGRRAKHKKHERHEHHARRHDEPCHVSLLGTV